MMDFEKEFSELNELRMEGFVEEDGTLGYSLEKEGDYVQIHDVYNSCLGKQRVQDSWNKFKEGLKMYPLQIIKAEEFEKELRLE